MRSVSHRALGHLRWALVAILRRLDGLTRYDVSIDFDGVLHAHRREYTRPGEILDGPTPGAVPFVRELLADGARVAIFSGRNYDPDGVAAMRAWLHTHGLTHGEVGALDFPLFKPLARVHLDDRALQFAGVWPTVARVRAFHPWNRQPGF